MVSGTKYLKSRVHSVNTLVEAAFAMGIRSRTANYARDSRYYRSSPAAQQSQLRFRSADELVRLTLIDPEILPTPEICFT